MSTYSFRSLTAQPLRLTLTVGGIALCVVLMLFLLAVYRGVEQGSMDYIRQNKADLWVLQQDSWNILRGSSLLSTGQGRVLTELECVESASPILLLLPGIQHDGNVATVYLAGYEPGKLGGPPRIVKGRPVNNDDEIVLDKAFASRLKIVVGDTVFIKDEPLSVVGFSDGTNAFVIQYAFSTLSRAQYIAGISTVVTCYLVRIKPGFAPPNAREQIRSALPGVEVYDHKTFIDNNVREMKSGFLPLLFIIAVIGAIVLTAILSLLLSMNILERRRDFAVMKTLGSPRFFLAFTVIKQALIISGLACSVGILVFFPMCGIIEHVAPEMSPQSSLIQIASVIVASVIISLASSCISIHKLRHIYPLEVFT